MIEINLVPASVSGEARGRYPSCAAPQHCVTLSHRPSDDGCQFGGLCAQSQHYPVDLERSLLRLYQALPKAPSEKPDSHEK